MERHAALTPGNVYKNKGGGEFRCESLFDDGAVMVNIKSGWRLEAHVVTMYDDGTIEWDFSTGGYFKNEEV